MSDVRDAVGVVIGRFQIDRLHAGHLALLDYVGSLHSRMLILVGVRDTPPTKTNPLSYEIRERMIRTQYPNAIILPLLDTRNNGPWSKQVDETIFKAFGHIDAVLYCGRDGFGKAYEGKHPVVTYHAPNVPNRAATAHREVIGKSPEHDEAFRRGIIYAMENLPHRFYMTVDIAMLKAKDPTNPSDMTQEVLLGRKKGETRLRFPGGFVEPGEDLRQAAMREFREETGLSCGLPTYIQDFDVPDWRIRDAKGVTHKTFLFKTTYLYGAPRAEDDLEVCGWVNLDADFMSQLTEEHRPLGEALLRSVGISPTPTFSSPIIH